MTRNIEETATMATDPDGVWAVVGDVAGVSTWVPALESSSLDGDLRTATFAGGVGVAHERIVHRDDTARSYTYSYVDGPLALERYVSTITVYPAGEGSRVVWTAEFAAGSDEEEAGLVEAIAGIYAGALAELTGRLDP